MIKRIFITCFVLLALLYYSQKPVYEGTYTHNYEKYGEIIIHREKINGIPHIKGQDITAICFGQGFAHAQDRLYQMHLKRLFASGRLSEFVGEKTVDIDKLIRQMKFRAIAQKTLDEQVISGDAFECLQAYSDGINQYVSQLKVLPLEFQIAGLVWEDWNPIDSIMQGKFIVWTVSVDHIYELMRTKLAKIVGEQKARDYFGMGSEFQFENTVILSDEDLKQSNIYEKYEPNNMQMDSDIGQIFKDIDLDFPNENVSETPGSNSWVISGEHTYSGKPLLANDPHLPNNMPTIWYQQEFLYEYSGKQKSAIGVSMPGFPGIIIGKFDSYSFGITILMADISDYYVEKLDENQLKYEVDGQWKDLIEVDEEIKVKKGKTIKYKRYETHRGILQTKMLNSKLGIVQNIKPVSLAWIGETPDDFHGAFLKFLKIGDNIEDIKNTSFSLPGPGCTILFATQNNDIGVIGVGDKPIRKNQRAGGFLKLGTNSDNEWIGVQEPKKAWPHVFNPKKGYIVTANNKFSTDNIVHASSVNLFSTFRGTRITEMIEEHIQLNKKFTMEDMIRMQSDTLDIGPQKVLPNLIRLFEKNSAKIFECEQKIQVIQQLLNKLKTWNFRIEQNNIESSIYTVWIQHFLDIGMDILKDKNSRNVLKKSIHFDQYLYRKLKEFGNNQDQYKVNEEWCMNTIHDNISIQNKDCIYNLFNSLYETQTYLQQNMGNDWRQGLLHEQQFPHHSFSKTPLRSLFDRSFRSYGNHKTVAVANQKLAQNSFHSAYGANYRQIVDFAKGSKSYYVVDTGISENFFSQYYDDQVIYKIFQYTDMGGGGEYLYIYCSILIYQKWLRMHERFQYYEMKYGYDRLIEYELVLNLIPRKQ